LRVDISDFKSFIMTYRRWRAKPWYKPERNGLSALMDTFAVMIGYYDYLPGREFRSEGYRLEELVSLSQGVLSR
jgi:hypothetical protein